MRKKTYKFNVNGVTIPVVAEMGPMNYALIPVYKSLEGIKMKHMISTPEDIFLFEEYQE